VFPKALDLDRPKRARTMFSSEQLRRLEEEFHRNQYLVGVERAELAIQLGLSETQVITHPIILINFVDIVVGPATNNDHSTTNFCKFFRVIGQLISVSTTTTTTTIIGLIIIIFGLFVCLNDGYVLDDRPEQ